jgi:mono/diheme cytochrome c family protein
MNFARRLLIAVSLTALSLTIGCKLKPRTPEVRYSLNHEAIAKNEDLAADPAAQAQLEGVLEFLFGTAKSPRLLALPEWLDDGFDPNNWGYETVSADDAAWQRLQESNARAYRAQIEAIRAGDFDAVEHPRYADDLWQDWLDLRADMPEAGPDATYLTTDDGTPVTWREEAIYRFESYYPTLSSSAEMYRQQCFHCHGAEGGGDGSTSQFLNPRPRDYRPGKFKFTPLREKAHPRHEDLFRILAEGIYTTAMPSFRRFTDAQLHGLVDYVKLLSIRGETELLLVGFFDPEEGIHFDNVRENYELVVGRWREADEKLIAFEGEVPRPTPERIEHGRWLFMTPGEKGGANCASCHGASGRGDGASAFEPDPETGELRPVKDDWGNPIQVRDLTRGVFRFGRRPIDLYRRIHAGINGTPMPEHFGMTITENGEQRTLNEDDLWDLVFFVRSMSTLAGEPSAAGADPEHD